MITEIENTFGRWLKFLKILQVEIFFEYFNIYLHVLKEFRVNILLVIFFTSILPCFEFSIKDNYYIYRGGQLIFLNFYFHWHVGPHLARTYHSKQLENAILKQMKPGIINLNKWDSFKNKYNLPNHKKKAIF